MNTPAQQPVSDPGPDNPEVTWWCKLLARVIGTIGGGLAICFGIWTCVTVHPICIVSGILLMLAALLVLVFEAPICFQFLEFTKPIAAFAERRTFMQKAFIYCGVAIAPVAMCFGVSTLLGCAFIFAPGVLYGLMALGKKADRSTMIARAATGGVDDKVTLVPNEQLPS